jgi:Ca2+/Na+ antiporter
MRRVFATDSPVRSALWAQRVAVFSAFVTLITLLMIRGQRIDVTTSMVLLSVCLVLVVLSLVLACATVRTLWNEGSKGLSQVVMAFVVCGAILLIPLIIIARMLWLPTLHDISTDLETPPSFVSSPIVLAKGVVLPADLPRDDRMRQRKAYPQISPLTLDLPLEDVVELVQKAMKQRGMVSAEEIIIPSTSAPPASVPTHASAGVEKENLQKASKTKSTLKNVPVIQPNTQLAAPSRASEIHIYAIERSFLTLWPIDVVVRLKPRGESTRVDVRAVSRVIRHDVGENAYRIQAFLDNLTGLANAR